MTQHKGVKRRSRVAGRDDVTDVRWSIDLDTRDSIREAALRSGLSESLYIDQLLKKLSAQMGGFPALDIDGQSEEAPISSAA